MNKTLVIIPTYNEKENIETVIKQILSLNFREGNDFHILVVDDGSPDGTAQLVKNMITEYPMQIHVLERKGKLGLGTAYLHGFKWSLRRNYDFICEMDADLSHNPLDLVRLRDVCLKKNKDVAIGSRYVKGGKCVNWPMDRLVLSRGASVYVQAILGLPIKDPTAGFICYRRRVLESINLEQVEFVGYAFQIEMKYTAYKLGFDLIEIPITFKDRIVGTSKMSNNIITEAVWGVLQLRWKFRRVAQLPQLEEKFLHSEVLARESLVE